MKRHAFVTLVLVGVGGLACMGQQAATRQAVGSVWALHQQMEQFLENDVVTDWRSVRIMAREEGVDAEGLAKAVWEVRTADGKQQVARLAKPWGRGGEIDNMSTTFMLSAADQAALAKAGDGEYLAAWVVGGKRVSNVVQVKVDAAHKMADEPLVRVRLAEPVAEGMSPLVVVTAVRHREDEPAFRTMEMMLCELFVDGKVYRLRGAGGSSPGPMHVGEARSVGMSLAAFSVTWDGTKAHTLKVRVLAKDSAEVRADPGTPWAAAWDGGTAALGAVMAERVRLAGKAAGPDGKPAAGYEVMLTGEGGRRFAGKTNADGTYAFSGVPDGDYELASNPVARGQPQVVISGVKISGEQAVKEDLSFEGKFEISGRVIGADGKAAAGRAVDATWTSADGKTTFLNTVDSGADGTWTMKGPLEKVSYVGLSGTGKQPAPYHDVKAGRKDLDFRVK